MEPSQQIYVPPGFYCPITGDIMNEPVTDNEGNSYEKSEILRWISTNKTSPITRSYLDESLLHDDISLKRNIESIRSKLTEDQLKMNARVVEAKSAPFRSIHDEIKLNSYYMDDDLFINIVTPDIDIRPPVDLVLCIDVSYSMFDEATLKGEKNETISHGFSVLSLTIIAAKTILNSLNENDNISIVTYSSEAHTLFENVSCSSENKIMIEEGLNSIKPISRTNMWAGMLQSLDILRETSPKNKVKGILLLTDGIPNVVPPRGHINMLEKYFRDNDFKCMFSCYGFGYNLESELLSDISQCSGGDGYSFIPDASLLGTTFIHGISNLLTTAVYNPILKINLSKNVRFLNGSEDLEVTLDSLKYGKEKNLIFKVNTEMATSRSLDHLNDFAKITLTFDDKSFEINENKRPPRDYYMQQLYRTRSVDMITNCIAKKKFNDYSFRDDIIQFTKELEKENSIPFIQDLLYDINGQVKEALNMTSQGEREDWFTKWGIHYLRSLKEAYQQEMCNNFKDRAISNFGGGLFNTLREEVSDIFDQQPPPKRDIPQYSSQRHTQNQTVQRNITPVSMSLYNNASGGCCVEGSRVLMANGNHSKVEDIRKNDRVVTYHILKDKNGQYHETYSTSSIECVVKTKCKNNTLTIVNVNNLRITPYHPIIDLENGDKDWIYPINKGKQQSINCEYMYSFVVENRHSLSVDNFIYATYGHNIDYDEVIQHNFFGTDKVINDLKKYETYNDGIVILEQDNFIRDEDDVVAIR